MLFVYWFVTTLVGRTGAAAACRFSQINQAFLSGSGPTAGTFWLNGLAGITGWGIAWSDDFLYIEFNRIPAGLSERSTSPLFAAAIVVWPIATFTILLIFAASMRRAKVRKIHVARCLIYSSDAGVWLAGGVVLVVGIYAALAAMFGEPLFSPWPILLLLLVRWWLAVNWKMYYAYRYYLRFNHAFATIASSQVILLLLALWLAL